MHICLLLNFILKSSRCLTIAILTPDLNSSFPMFYYALNKDRNNLHQRDLKAIFKSFKAKPLIHILWRTLKKLRVSCFRPTRRGKRAGQRKQRSISVSIGRRDQGNTVISGLAEMHSASDIFRFIDGNHLHIPKQNLLNIQIDTPHSDIINNTGVTGTTDPLGDKKAPKSQM